MSANQKRGNQKKNLNDSFWQKKREKDIAGSNVHNIYALLGNFGACTPKNVFNCSFYLQI